MARVVVSSKRSRGSRSSFAVRSKIGRRTPTITTFNKRIIDVRQATRRNRATGADTLTFFPASRVIAGFGSAWDFESYLKATFDQPYEEGGATPR